MTKNILSSDVQIIGDVKFSQDLIVDGKIEGQIFSDGDLTIGEHAQIKGEVHTQSVTVFGKVEGNLDVKDRCELKSCCELIGDATAGALSMEDGATFVGRSQMKATNKGKAA